jgi:DNA excision repair protein ERCC-4
LDIDDPVVPEENPDISSIEFVSEFDTFYGLLAPEETVIIRAYSDDTDDRMLDEIKPRFIVMFEPCMEFVRRVEVGAYHFALVHAFTYAMLSRYTSHQTLDWLFVCIIWFIQTRAKSTSILLGYVGRRKVLKGW